MRLIDRLFYLVCKFFDLIDPQVRREKKKGIMSL